MTALLTPSAAPPQARRVVVAAFSTSDGATRAAEAMTQAYPGGVGNAAILFVSPAGGPTFVTLKDWGGGRGALVAGVAGIIGESFDIVAGDGVRALAGLLVNGGLADSKLRLLGRELATDQSVVVLDLHSEVTGSARRRLRVLGAVRVLEQPIGPDLAHLFTPDPPPNASPSTQRRISVA